ncbi:hypothetical protein GYA19_00260 [Candidatus Beckwithbacteria bacterium]|nr:hypothetical protein [Candidatus Beckwithbacteria bacterium]
MAKRIFSILILFFLILTACDLQLPQTQTETNKVGIQEEQKEQEKNKIIASEEKGDNAPLPSAEYIINLFFKLINEKHISEAIAMMGEKMIPDDNAKQAWGVQFNAFESINVLNLEPYNQDTWTNTERIYKVSLETSMSPDSANAPIPYYGWDGNPNIRWVSVEKDSQNLWKIASISTGP